MYSFIQISALLLVSLFLSCTNTKNASADANLKTTPTREVAIQDDAKATGVFVESDKKDISENDDRYSKNEIFLAIKEESGISLVNSLENIEGDKASPLSAFSKQYPMKSISRPMVGLKPQLYKIKFPDGTDLVKAIETLESYPFVEYAERIPLNK